MNNLEQRVARLELLAAQFQHGQQIQGVQSSSGGGTPQQFSGSNGYLSALITNGGSDLAAGGNVGGQAVWTKNNGGRDYLDANATIYNDTTNAIKDGSQVFLAQNRDRSYTVIGVAC